MTALTAAAFRAAYVLRGWLQRLRWLRWLRWIWPPLLTAIAVAAYLVRDEPPSNWWYLAVLLALMSWVIELQETLIRRLRNDRDLRLAAVQLRADRAEQTVDAIRADADGYISELRDRNTRLTQQLAEATRRGEKAAVAAMTSLAKQQDEHAESLVAWQQIATIALLMPSPTQRALPAAPTMPEVLPSGEHALAGDVLVQLDDVDSWDDLGAVSLPTTNGTRPTTRTRTRKKAGQ